MKKKTIWKKDFILLLQGSAVSTFGAVLYSAAIGYWVFQTTGSTSLMGILSSITLIVRVVLSPIAGVIADHLNRRNMLVITDAVRGVFFVILGILALQGHMQVWMIAIVAVVSGICSALFNPSSISLAPDILGESKLVQGQAVMNGGTTMIDLIGSGMSGTFIVLFGAPLLILVNGICFLFSAISEMFIRHYPSHNQDTSISFSQITKDFKEGFQICFKTKAIFKLGTVILLANLFASGFWNLLVAYTESYGMTTQQYGYLAASFSAGSLIGALIVGAINIPPQKQVPVSAIAFILGSILEAIGIYWGKFLPTIILLFLGQIFNGIGNNILTALLILFSPKEKRGTISGFVVTIISIGTVSSYLLYGFLGDLIPLHWLGSIGMSLSIIPLLTLLKGDTDLTITSSEQIS